MLGPISATGPIQGIEVYFSSPRPETLLERLFECLEALAELALEQAGDEDHAFRHFEMRHRARTMLDDGALVEPLPGS